MSLFRYTAEGDIYRPTSATGFERVKGPEECAVHLRTRLRLFTGEVFRDRRIGVQYFELALTPGISPIAVANHINSVCLDTPGIVDSELTFEVEPIRGIVTIEVDADYQEADQLDRMPIHERIEISVGGSIQL